MYVFCPHSPQEDKQEQGTAPPMGATEPAEPVGLSMWLPVAQGSTADPASIVQQLVNPLNSLILQSTQGTFATNT